jgi:undecaprenyl-diphosphatase
MNWIQAIILGLIQGLTEFLPVSSTGHLELFKHLLGIDPEANFYFSIAVHGATVLSTVIVFRKDILNLIKGFFQFNWNEETIYTFKLIVSMFPTMIAGLFMKEIAENYFTGNMTSLGIQFFITAILLLMTFIIKFSRERPIGFADAFVIGIAQAIAILPAVSRSGATIATGMMLGNRKSDLARFSFLMVLVPIIFANIIEMKAGDFSSEGTSAFAIVAGFIAAFVSGYLACRWMINLVRKGNLGWFALYCILVGVISILLGLHVI